MKKTFSVSMDEEIIKQLDALAEKNHRKRGPEVNVAVEFYLKHHNVDFSTPATESKEDPKEVALNPVKVSDTKGLL